MVLASVNENESVITIMSFSSMGFHENLSSGSQVVSLLHILTVVSFFVTSHVYIYCVLNYFVTECDAYLCNL